MTMTRVRPGRVILLALSRFGEGSEAKDLSFR
jgi:hypothetical protein